MREGYIPAGNNSISFSQANTVFNSNPAVLDVSADLELRVAAFKLQAFAQNPLSNTVDFMFGGRAGETWDIQTSNDLTHWNHLAFQAFPTDGVASVNLNNSTPPFYVKAIKQ